MSSLGDLCAAGTLDPGSRRAIITGASTDTRDLCAAGTLALGSSRAMITTGGAA